MRTRRGETRRDSASDEVPGLGRRHPMVATPTIGRALGSALELEHAEVREVAVALRVVEPVADDEDVLDGEA